MGLWSYSRLRSTSPASSSSSSSSPTRQSTLFAALPQNMHAALPSRFGRREVLFTATVLALVLCSTLWFSPSDFVVADYLPNRLASGSTSISGLLSTTDRIGASIADEYVGQIVNLDGVILAPSFDATVAQANASGNVDDGELLHILAKDLEARFNTLITNNEPRVAIPDCPALDLGRYEPSRIFFPPATGTKKPILSIALNLHQNEAILPALSIALLSTIWHMRTSHSIHISIFENGSNDRTRIYLGHLASALLSIPDEAVKILAFRSSSLRRLAETERIVALAGIRNEALAPLIPYMTPSSPSSNSTNHNNRDRQQGTLLFVNDVITCPFDLLELIHQLHLQTADVAVSTDWNIVREGPDDEHKKPQAQFYDKWVSRGINGKMPYPFADQFPWVSPTHEWARDLWTSQDEKFHARWLDGRPIPLYSGWNGAVAARSSLFSYHHIRFRASGLGGWRGGATDGKLGDWGRLVATPGYLESDCAASECKLFARDVWHVLNYTARFVLASQSRTTYSVGEWKEVVHDCEVTVPPTFRRGAYGGADASDNKDAEGNERLYSEEDDLKVELVDWDEAVMPETVACVSGLDEEKKYQNPFYNHGENHVPIFQNPRFDGWEP